MSKTPFRRILVPIDFTEEADVAVHSGFEAELEGGKVGVAQASIKSLELAAGIIDEGGELRLLQGNFSCQIRGVRGCANPCADLGIHRVLHNVRLCRVSAEQLPGLDPPLPRIILLGRQIASLDGSQQRGAIAAHLVGGLFQRKGG